MRTDHGSFIRLVPIFFIALLQYSVGAIEDGVYEVAADGTPAKRVALNVTRGHVLSQSNANDKWSLFVCYSPQGFLEGNQYGVVLDGAVCSVSSWGKSGNTENDFSLLLGTKKAEAAARLFGFKPIPRKHPDHRLDAAFETDKAAYAPGEEIIVKMKITNVSDKPFFFQNGGQQRGPRNDQFIFSGTGPGGSIPVKEAMNFGGISVTQEIAPGATFELSVSLKGWFELTTPGHYNILGSYHLPIYATKDIHLFSVWTDYLTRPFTVQIKNPAEKK